MRRPPPLGPPWQGSEISSFTGENCHLSTHSGLPRSSLFLPSGFRASLGTKKKICSGHPHVLKLYSYFKFNNKVVQQWILRNGMHPLTDAMVSGVVLQINRSWVNCCAVVLVMDCWNKGSGGGCFNFPLPAFCIKNDESKWKTLINSMSYSWRGPLMRMRTCFNMLVFSKAILFIESGFMSQLVFCVCLLCAAHWPMNIGATFSCQASSHKQDCAGTAHSLI